MISLKDYIINEELDNNFEWMLDKWFERNSNQLNEFIYICNKCKNDRVPLNDNIEKYLENTELKKQLSKFINFIYNDIEYTPERNDIEYFKVIIKQILSDKSKNNKYLI